MPIYPCYHRKGSTYRCYLLCNKKCMHKNGERHNLHENASLHCDVNPPYTGLNHNNQVRTLHFNNKFPMTTSNHPIGTCTKKEYSFEKRNETTIGIFKLFLSSLRFFRNATLAIPSFSIPIFGVVTAKRISYQIASIKEFKFQDNQFVASN